MYSTVTTVNNTVLYVFEICYDLKSYYHEKKDCNYGW